MLKALDRTRGATSDDAVRLAAKASVRKGLIDAGYPLTISFKGEHFAGEGKPPVSVGEIVLRPSFYEKSGRVAYMGGGDVTICGVKNRCNITVFLPFTHDATTSPEAAALAEGQANASMDAGEQD